MTSNSDLQKIIRLYTLQTGETELDMRKVGEFAVKNGIELPKPADPMDMLVKRLSRAAAKEIRQDKETGSPYRAYHSLPIKQGQQALFVWVDIDKATRPQMQKSLTMRREQMVGDALQLSYDADHWNASNPEDEPIQMDLDLSLDVEWRKAADDDEEEAA